MKYVNNHFLPIISWIITTFVGIGFLYLPSLDYEEIPYISFAPLSTASVFITWTVLLPYLLKSLKLGNKEDIRAYSIQIVATHLFLDFLAWGFLFSIIGILYFTYLSAWFGYLFLYFYSYKCLTQNLEGRF